MTIRKTPQCPFCDADMIKDPGIYDNGAIIITKRGYDELEKGDKITATITLRVFECDKCGFVAFWHGEPQ